MFFTKIWSSSAKLSCQKFLRWMEQHIWKRCQFYAKSLCFHNIKKVCHKKSVCFELQKQISKEAMNKYFSVNNNNVMFAGVGFQLSEWIFQLWPLPLMVEGSSGARTLCCGMSHGIIITRCSRRKKRWGLFAIIRRNMPSRCDNKIRTWHVRHAKLITCF